MVGSGFLSAVAALDSHLFTSCTQTQGSAQNLAGTPSSLAATFSAALGLPLSPSSSSQLQQFHDSMRNGGFAGAWAGEGNGDGSPLADRAKLAVLCATCPALPACSQLSGVALPLGQHCPPCVTPARGVPSPRVALGTALRVALRARLGRLGSPPLQCRGQPWVQGQTLVLPEHGSASVGAQG